jgi:hypothetical protein
LRNTLRTLACKAAVFSETKRSNAEYKLREEGQKAKQLFVDLFRLAASASVTASTLKLDVKMTHGG